MAYLSKLGIVLVGTVAITAGLGGIPAMAQNQPSSSTGTASVLDPNAGYTSPDGGSDLFSSPTAPLELIHRAILMNNMSLSEFQAQQRQRMPSVVDNFHQLQREALRQQPEDAPVTDSPAQP